MYFLPLPQGQGALRPILRSAGTGAESATSTVHIPIQVYGVDCRAEHAERLAAHLCDRPLPKSVGRAGVPSSSVRNARMGTRSSLASLELTSASQALPRSCMPVTKPLAHSRASPIFSPSLAWSRNPGEYFAPLRRRSRGFRRASSTAGRRGLAPRPHPRNRWPWKRARYPLVREGSLGTDRGSREQALDEGEHALFSRADAVGRIVEHAGYRSGDGIGGRWPGCKAHGGACPFGGGTRSH